MAFWMQAPAGRSRSLLRPPRGASRRWLLRWPPRGRLPAMELPTLALQDTLRGARPIQRRRPAPTAELEASWPTLAPSLQSPSPLEWWCSRTATCLGWTAPGSCWRQLRIPTCVLWAACSSSASRARRRTRSDSGTPAPASSSASQSAVPLSKRPCTRRSACCDAGGGTGARVGSLPNRLAMTAFPRLVYRPFVVASAFPFA
mmetsp:Transcript_18991/g.72520  ORF Transcript_18991/g.72520 Transcript_18991/m.72520 type:complete len:202 (-) Transcript_18991:969-1574(-)